MRLTLFAALALAVPADSHAQDLENFDRLDARIAVALGGNATDSGRLAQPIDRRLRLAACPMPAAIEPPTLGAVTIRCQSIGWRLRVPLMATSQTDRTVVRRGDPVELTLTGNGFSVVTNAIAQEDAAMGAAIRVKTSSSGATVVARVVESGRVSLGD